MEGKHTCSKGSKLREVWMNRKNINWLERLSVVILANEPSCVVKEVNCGRSIQ